MTYRTHLRRRLKRRTLNQAIKLPHYGAQLATRHLAVAETPMQSNAFTGDLPS